jgi:hypothetical protein
MERVKNYIILALSIALGWMTYLQSMPELIPVDIVTIIPPSEGTSGLKAPVAQDSLPEPIEVIVYLPGKVEKKIVVDSLYKKKYDQAIADNDSIKARNLFLETIQVKEYNEVAVNNDDIKIDLYAKVRGSLLGYRVDYNIKEKKHTYTPEVVYARPKVTVLLGSELVFPDANKQIAIKGSVGFQNRKGHIYSAGVDTYQNVYIGYTHAVSLKNLNPFRRKR